MTSSAPTSRAQQAPLPASSSSTNAPPPTGGATEKSYFETQRAALIGEIAISMEHVLSNINKLNRSLEGVIAVGNEFGSVEALWSQFENVMAKDTSVVEGGPDHATAGGGGGGGLERGHGHGRGEGDDDED